MPDVVVVGSHTSGYLMHCTRLPTRGEYLMAQRFEQTLDGGKGSNQAFALARLGARTSFVGLLGDDAEGALFANYCRKYGVNYSNAQFLPGKSTAMGIAFIDPAGQIMGATAPGVLTDMTTADVDCAKAAIAACDVLLTQLEIPHEVALYACELAKRYGKTAILNPAPADGMLAEDTRHIDILTPNEPEAKFLLGFAPDEHISTEELAQAFREKRPDAITVVTLGADGALIVAPDFVRHIACPAVDAVDTSGAGDCFNAALAFQIGQGSGIEAAVRFAVKAASMSVEKAQVWESYPTLAEIELRYGNV